MLYRFLDFTLRDHPGAQIGCEGKRGGITQARQRTLLPGLFIDPEQQSLRLVFGYYCCRMAGPFAVALKQKLQRKSRQINTSQPVRCKALHNSMWDRAACL